MANGHWPSLILMFRVKTVLYFNASLSGSQRCFCAATLYPTLTTECITKLYLQTRQLVVDLQARKIHFERLLKLPVLKHADCLTSGAGALLAKHEQPLLLLLFGVQQVIQGEVQLVRDPDPSVSQEHRYLQSVFSLKTGKDNCGDEFTVVMMIEMAGTG